MSVLLKMPLVDLLPLGNDLGLVNARRGRVLPGGVDSKSTCKEMIVMTALNRDNLATFVDRWTMQHVRVLPFLIERVWRAVTTQDELNAWFLPIARVEPKLGGRASFTWGRPESEPQVGDRNSWSDEVVIFESPRVIRFQRPQGESDPLREGYFQFELETIPQGTRFAFIQRFPPEFRQDQTEFDPNRRDAALPAGSDTPWRPGFVAGFHGMFDDLGSFLAEEWSPERIRNESTRRVDIVNGKSEGSLDSSKVKVIDDRWGELVEVYYDYIRDNCPPDHRGV